jgi:uncharacterized membrane protein
MTDIQKSMKATFVSLRMGIGIIGILFPFILWIGGKISGFPLQSSMSAYYHANPACLDPDHPPPHAEGTPNPRLIAGAGPMRDYFVGILFAVGSVLFLYKGFSRWENMALNLGGICAVLIALFPMSWNAGESSLFSPHLVFALTFFACIAFVGTFCSEKTLRFASFPGQGSQPARRYRVTYAILALLMMASPVAAILFNWSTGQSSKGFYMETFGILAFGIFWLVKTSELNRNGLEAQAISGTINMDRRSMMGDKAPKIQTGRN